MNTQQAIYFFAPTQTNIEKFEGIQSQVNEQVGYSFTNQYVKKGNTNILTNFTDLQGNRIKAIIQQVYFCTIFEFNQELHDFMLTFDDIHYFDNQQAAQNFVNGIASV